MPVPQQRSTPRAIMGGGESYSIFPLPGFCTSAVVNCRVDGGLLAVPDLCIKERRSGSVKGLNGGS